MSKIWIMRDWDEYSHSRSTPLRIGPWRDAVLHGPRLGSEIHTGGGNPDGKYKKTGSGSTKMAISDPETLPTGSRTSEPALTGAISERADQHNDIVRPPQVEVGSRGYAKKLAHLWHGPFRVAEKVGEYAVKFEIASSAYNIFPVVHVSKIKLVREFPDRPDRDPDEDEVEMISDMRTGRRTRYGRILRKFLIHWCDNEDPTWIDEADLNCGAILHEFLRDRANQNRFGVMQSHEEV
ncbi:hypothetical protein PHMEG_00027600 [Phytophthora megakarya]|uniref:Chromo domain-containing protein n=1 Tax=Phytophthora megakarya TaxID=4795 RepID=A0A225V599_9STRA|nr:hypothetical protein PHMEG_00027600 [Phytophthora megakarya]